MTAKIPLIKPSALATVPAQEPKDADARWIKKVDSMATTMRALNDEFEQAGEGYLLGVGTAAQMALLELRDALTEPDDDAE